MTHASAIQHVRDALRGQEITSEINGRPVPEFAVVSREALATLVDGDWKLRPLGGDGADRTAPQAAPSVARRPDDMPIASWGPKCSVRPSLKCDTRRLNERDGLAYWSMWEGLLYPITADTMMTVPYAWSFCPWCGGEVRLGIRQQIDSYRSQADGEGDGC
jgi:hypothetical protein